jgi:hypothetical protein
LEREIHLGFHSFIREGSWMVDRRSWMDEEEARGRQLFRFDE